MIEFLLAGFEKHGDAEALVWQGRSYTYRELAARVEDGLYYTSEVAPGTVAALDADFSPNGVGLWLALVQRQAILVPLSAAVGPKRQEFLDVAQVEQVWSVDRDDRVRLVRTGVRADHELYARLRTQGHAGLVLFSSGSTGTSKGAVHDVVPLLEKFKRPRKTMRSISFLLYDHIGGINTMLYSLANGGCLIAVRERTPDAVLAAVEAHRVELLPTSPTFINLILMSEAYARHDLSSLKIVSYGTEPMPESTLARFHQLFPQVELLQTYGLSEVGILRSKSEKSDSLWVKLGGEGYETRVVDGILHVKAESAMLGYLNAPSPFSADGWFITGDRVEVRGEYFRVLGRESEIINVGGEKVYPAEVESVLLELDNVAEATVFAERNPIVGQMVCARVRLIRAEDPKQAAARLKQACREKLQAFKVPVKLTIAREEQHSARFKTLRKSA